MPSFEPVASVSWEQVMAYRLHEHHVIERTMDRPLPIELTVVD